MSILDIEALKTSEKFIIMEQLWDSISKDVNNKQLTPSWHLDILETREEKVVSNQSKFYDIEESKKKLEALLK